METNDSLMTVMRLVDSVARHSTREKMLQKRRADVRYPVDMPLPLAFKLLTPQNFIADTKGFVLDISYRGIGMLLMQRVEPKTQVTIGLLPFDLPHTVVTGRVVYCRALMGTLHRVGIEFTHEDNAARRHIQPRGTLHTP
jgi:c-di-GMP-binding flagellar brake protein YcgR